MEAIDPFRLHESVQLGTAVTDQEGFLEQASNLDPAAPPFSSRRTTQPPKDLSYLLKENYQDLLHELLRKAILAPRWPRWPRSAAGADASHGRGAFESGRPARDDRDGPLPSAVPCRGLGGAGGALGADEGLPGPLRAARLQDPGRHRVRRRKTVTVVIQVDRWTEIRPGWLEAACI